MANFSQNGVNFTNVNADTIYNRNGKYTHGSNADGNKFDITLTESELTKSINAIEIDWNSAEWPSTDVQTGPNTINTSGDLINAIKWASQTGPASTASQVTWDDIQNKPFYGLKESETLSVWNAPNDVVLRTFLNGKADIGI